MTDEIQAMTASGSGKSEAEIAFELVNKLKGQGVWGERNITAILDMYAECLDAARGLRQYPGQKRYDAPIAEGNTPAKQTTEEASAPTAQEATPQADAAPAQAAAPAQPVQQAPQPAPAQQAAAQHLTPEQMAQMNAERQTQIQAQQQAQQTALAQQKMLQQQLKQA